MFRLGSVPSGVSAEWSRYTGMLALPYLTVNGPASVKFRHLDGTEPKYLAPEGQELRLFNVRACMHTGGQIIVTEGEIDAITLHAECGLPAVGVPGASSWRKHYRRLLEGFNDVVILTDNDVKSNGSNPGRDLALKIKDSISQSRIVSLPPGEDVNSYFKKVGKEGMFDLIPDVE